MDTTTTSEKLSYACPCGKTHQATLWAAAHWGEQLMHKCDVCGRTNTIRGGKVLKSKTPRKESEHAQKT